jgi:hypothetical protein
MTQRWLDSRDASTTITVLANTHSDQRLLTLPDGSPLFIKVATQDTGGAFFLTEQPSGQKAAPRSTFISRKMSGSTASRANTSLKSAINDTS